MDKDRFAGSATDLAGKVEGTGGDIARDAKAHRHHPLAGKGRYLMERGNSRADISIRRYHDTTETTGGCGFYCSRPYPTAARCSLLLLSNLGKAPRVLFPSLSPWSQIRIRE